MELLYLIKLGEIQLKDGNKAFFENRLKSNIKNKLASIKHNLLAKDGRYYLRVQEENALLAEAVLATTPGLNGWARTEQCEKSMDEIINTAICVMQKNLANNKTFKVVARRSDKSFSQDSYGISCKVGEALLEKFLDLKVDVKNPSIIINVEVREKAYIYANSNAAIRGLPVGTGGTGLLLLSGGIDSPVAGYKMMTRGLDIEALYFHAWPYTSDEALQKVKSLAAILAKFSGRIILHTAHFTDLQMAIKKAAPEACTTLFLRAAMMMAANILAGRRNLSAIITGESLGQVASQTAENMRFTGSFTDFPVLRPLVGSDKEEIIFTAKNIGSYETSILPYDDCCVLFSPKHPILKANFYKEKEAFEHMNLGDEITKAVNNIVTEEIKAY